MLFRSIGGKLGNWNPVASSGGVQYPQKKNTCILTKYFFNLLRVCQQSFGRNRRCCITMFAITASRAWNVRRAGSHTRGGTLLLLLLSLQKKKELEDEKSVQGPRVCHHLLASLLQIQQKPHALPVVGENQTLVSCNSINYFFLFFVIGRNNFSSIVT